MKLNIIFFLNKSKVSGDWGLGIGQSPIPNPQSPIPNPHHFFETFQK